MSKLGSKLVPRLGPAARSILAAGRGGDDPTPADRARVKQALMRSIAAGAAAPTPGSAAVVDAAAKATSIGLRIKLLGGAALIVAVGAGVLMQRASAPDPASVQAAPIAAAAASANAAPAAVDGANAAPAKAVVEDPVERVSEPVLEKAPAPVLSARSSASVKPVAPEATPALEEDPLVAETRRLRAAHGALQSGDPQKALALLDEQGGQLGQERAAARVLALCQMGRIAEAEAAGAAFLRDHPRSPLADRIRSGCAAANPR